MYVYVYNPLLLNNTNVYINSFFNESDLCKIISEFSSLCRTVLLLAVKEEAVKRFIPDLRSVTCSRNIQMCKYFNPVSNIFLLRNI